LLETQHEITLFDDSVPSLAESTDHDNLPSMASNYYQL